MPKKYGVLTNEIFPDGVVVSVFGEVKNGYVNATMPNGAFSGYRVDQIQPLPDDYVFNPEVENRRMMKSEFARKANVSNCLGGMENDVSYLNKLLLDSPVGAEEVSQLAAALQKLRELFAD